MKDYKQYLEKNKSLIEKSLEIDNSKWNENLSFKKLIEEEKININLERNKAYLVIYEGQPEITIQLLQKSIISNSSMLFTIKDYYLATNKILISIANKCVQENKIKAIHKLYNNIEEERIYKATKKADKTIYIGDIDNFNYIKNNIQSETIFIKYDE